MKRILKWIGIVFIGLLGIIVLLLIGTTVASANRLNQSYEVTADFSLDVPTDEKSIAEGERLYTILCSGCHGENLAGTEFVDDFLFGQIHSANLTSGAGGLGNDYTDEDFARAIWYGVKTDGSPTVGMPVELNRAVHVEDMGKLIAYMRSVPPVESDFPQMRPGVMMRVMHVTNIFPLVTAEFVDLGAAPPAAVVREDTLAYGEYLAVICTACHGSDYAGIEMAGGPNITPHDTALGAWTEDDLSLAVREGQRPDGTSISTEMPWQDFSNFSDEEIHAIWTYLQSVDPVAAD